MRMADEAAEKPKQPQLAVGKNSRAAVNSHWSLLARISQRGGVSGHWVNKKILIHNT